MAGRGGLNRRRRFGLGVSDELAALTLVCAVIGALVPTSAAAAEGPVAPAARSSRPVARLAGALNLTVTPALTRPVHHVVIDANRVTRHEAFGAKPAGSPFTSPTPAGVPAPREYTALAYGRGPRAL